MGAVVVDDLDGCDVAASDYRRVESVRNMNDEDWQIIDAAYHSLALVLPEVKDMIAKIRS